MSVTVPPTTHAMEAEHRRLIAYAVAEMAKGRSNATGNTTLTATSATTVVQDDRCGVDSAILMMPKDANAAAENWWIAPANGSFTINHANNALVRAFRYVIAG